MIPVIQIINAIGNKMALKPRPKLKGTSLGPRFKVKEGKVIDAGNVKASVSQKIAAKKKPKRKFVRVPA